ncbi:MAG: 6-carboxytetrahydropterin synthase [Candidatus Dormibacteraeota bacterium]|jgi:6-pyruvoyltetrahydropterin/6-carboxytetrahydropterin synthase|nr:6-carboxytetrahydropterin synthase [Candidatus Dormibacteraeota bacterium]
MLKISPEKGFKTELQAPTAVLVTRRVTFAAAHVLRRPEWDDRRNKEVFGQCAGDHGHNYVLEVSVSGEPDPATGMVVNLKDLDRAVKQAVVRHVDHRHLNRDVPFLEGVVPTAENLALVFWRQLDGQMGSGHLQRLRLVESENNSVEVTR